MKKYKYSEIFGNTIQGEGKWTGSPTIWVRFWGCNFDCDGFGQENPDDKLSYILPYQTIDIKSIKKVEDLPVFHTGCDSSYSWSKKFAHLAHTDTVEEICNKLEDFLKSESNPAGSFLHPKSKQWTHLAFTGGEPMINQHAIVDIMLEFAKRNNVPKYVTVETNGTQPARKKFQEYVTGYFDNYETADDLRKSFYMSLLRNFRAEGYTSLSLEEKSLQGIEWFWSVSPKLYLSGEKKSSALRPEVLRGYKDISNHGQLKYVSNGSERSWQEVEEFTEAYRKEGIDWPVWIMPVGADVEGQNKVAARITEEAVARGYNVAARVHTYIFGNVVGR